MCISYKNQPNFRVSDPMSEFVMMSGEQMCLPARFMNIGTRESLVLGSGRQASMIVTNISV